MKVVITGATRGIGLATTSLLTSLGHTVINLSRRSGHDIANPHSILPMLADAQVFINNAYSFAEPFAQTTLLYRVHELWRDTPNHIINIGSNSSDGIKNFSHIYATAKASLDKASEQLANTNQLCRVSNIRFGLVDTASSASIRDIEGQRRITPQEAAEAIVWVMNCPNGLLAKTLTLQPCQDSRQP